MTGDDSDDDPPRRHACDDQVVRPLAGDIERVEASETVDAGRKLQEVDPNRRTRR
jgi:hypothetical protein